MPQPDASKSYEKLPAFLNVRAAGLPEHSAAGLMSAARWAEEDEAAGRGRKGGAVENRKEIEETRPRDRPYSRLTSESMDNQPSS